MFDKTRMASSGIVLVNNHDIIIDNLWLGGNPVDVKEFRYLVVVNHAPRYHIPNGTMAVVYPFDDGDWLPDLEKLHELADTVNRFVDKGPTLVHCSAGLNRSGLVTALALIKRGMQPVDAIALLRAKRGSDVLYNKTFSDWLMTLSPGL